MKKFQVVDGNDACSQIAYYFSEVAEIYPITPSSKMAENVDQWSQTGMLNLFDMPVKVEQLQSEAGVAGAIHGSLAAGVLATTFTSSQGLLLMIPNMFKIAGELLPTVFHISARAVSTHALSIFAEHSDVMACRTTGFSMLCSSNVQEAQDMAIVSHISALKSSVPFMHFFDGFRTSHEIQKIKLYDNKEIKKLIPFDKIQAFKARALNPVNPHQQGTAQNPDIFFQNKEAQNQTYNQVFDIVKNTLQEVSILSGINYEPFEYFGSVNAKYVVVLMGSGVETAIETLEFLPKNYGVLKVRLYRPFNSQYFCDKLPKTVEKITVLDRTKENGSLYEPLCLDVISALAEQNRNIKVYGGRYGLGSKEFTPACVSAVFDNMLIANPKDHFSVGIVDDVTHNSLEINENFVPNNNDVYSLKFFGLGGDGTVSANKNSIKIIGEDTGKFVQGYFDYDSKKSGSLTVSHLRISNKPILSTYRVFDANFIAIHNFNFVARYDILNSLKQGGKVLLNTTLSSDELDKKLPKFFKSELIKKNANLFIINATKIANELKLNNKVNIIMQSAFFKISNIIDFDKVKNQMFQAIKKTYGKKGEKTILANYQAVEMGSLQVKKVDLSVLTEKNYLKEENTNNSEYYKKFVEPINSLKGNELPVSAFNPDGHVPTDTAKEEKRGIASKMPRWISENCIQCGMCTLSCPHAAIRSVIVKDDDLKDAPDGFVTVATYGVNGTRYKIQISPLDCTGCGVCANVCPALKKALVMEDMSNLLTQEKINYEYFLKLKNAQTNFSKTTVKGLQFEKPYFEFNSACAGCGETPYIKIATQLFGENMIIANATGCSSIYSGSAPSCPYSKNEQGEGPAWASSLLEDNAEFGLGMSFARDIEKAKITKYCTEFKTENPILKDMLTDFIKNPNSFSGNKTKEFVKLIESQPNSKAKTNILNSKAFIGKKSIWIIGGDGWAYDIGYGGLEHVLSTNQNVNVLVLDNEGYSNTGGQLSKSTPRGSFVKFAYGGKKTKKKNLGNLAMMTQNCFVASVGLGADMQQTITAFKEAEEFDGPSIIIAYSPCVNHGYDMEKSQEQIKKAVKSGYWNLFRYNPKTQKLNIDNPAPTLDFEDFLMTESRYSSLEKAFPKIADDLFDKAKQDAVERYEQLLKFKQEIENKKSNN